MSRVRPAAPGVACALALALGRPALAQPDPEWHQAVSPSERFVVLASGDAEVAALVAARVDAVHDGLSALFEGRLPGPITVTIHPSREAFLAANPLVASAGDADAVTRRARRAVDVYLRPVGAESEAALERDLRYALAHIFIARGSSGRMPPGIQEGLARYLADRPSPADGSDGAAAGVARLREAADAGALIAWADLAAPGAAYLAPELSQPQSLSIVHFLIEQEGLAAVLDLVGHAAVTEGWRHAFDAAFTRSPSELESAWRAWLPRYLAGGWRHHELYLDGLERAEDLLRSGRYPEAGDRLRATLGLLEGGDDPAGAARAKALLARAEAGLRDAESLGAASAALADGRYADAERLAQALIDRAPSGAPPDRVGSVAAEIARRAALGREATAALDRAATGPPWAAPLARLHARRAAAGFAELGDEIRAGQARALHGRGAGVFELLGAVSIGLGGIVLGRNLRQRRLAEAASAVGGAVTGGRSGRIGPT